VSDANWQRVKALFAEAMERPAHERVEFIDAVCAGDPAMRAELLSLLAAGEDSASVPRARAAVAAAARALAIPVTVYALERRVRAREAAPQP